MEAASLGANVEAHDIVTSDGYILKLFHLKSITIPQASKGPVLLMHGMLDSSDCWLTLRENSLVIKLLSDGYDIWLGNLRGNKYSRRHQSLNPNMDGSFWNYDFSNHGI